jgi:hypothetical protein
MRPYSARSRWNRNVAEIATVTKNSARFTDPIARRGSSPVATSDDTTTGPQPPPTASRKPPPRPRNWGGGLTPLVGTAKHPADDEQRHAREVDRGEGSHACFRKPGQDVGPGHTAKHAGDHDLQEQDLVDVPVMDVRTAGYAGRRDLGGMDGGTGDRRRQSKSDQAR